MSQATAIVAAAGRGTRLGRRKQLLDLMGKPVLAWCLGVLGRIDAVAGIVIACEPDETQDVQHLAQAHCGAKPCSIVRGGERRQDSVLAALKTIASPAGYVLVHDGARPFLTEDLVERVLAAAETTGAAIAAVPVKDTIKQSSDDETVARTIPREQLWCAQTPQAFALDVLRAAYEAAESEGFVGTDEATLVEFARAAQVMIVPGSYDNIKITTADDIAVAEAIGRRLLAPERA